MSMNDFVACVGDIDVPGVRYRHGEQFIQYCLGQDVSAATVAKKVKHLKRVFQRAEDRGQLDRPPRRQLKPPKVPRRRIRVFTDEECDRLCAAARQYEEKGGPIKWELLIRMCLSTGMRRGELMNATWRDIDFANLTVEVSGIETTDRFYVAIREDVIDRARVASEASRKGDSVAHLLRAPGESDTIGEPPCVSASWTKG